MIEIKEALRLAEAVEQNAEECEGDDGMVMVVPLDMYNELMEAIAAFAALRQAISEAESAYKQGAEAMRERCIQVCNLDTAMTFAGVREAIRAIPVEDLK